MDIYKYAFMNKLRFPYSKGVISVEDLYDLNMTELNNIYQNLKKEQKDNDAVDSLLDRKKTSASEKLEVQIAIVTDVFNEKKAVKEELAKAKEIADKKQKLASILESKRDEALQNKSIEELEAMLAGM